MKLRERMMRREYENFHWAVTWLITLVCNLKCSYCYVTPGAKHPDVRKALARVLEIKPKHLCLSGGEPTLVPGFTGILREIREALPLCDIVLNTNATLPDRVMETLPFISTLAFSIDGVGAVNRELRGVDGDVLLGTLEKLIRAQAASGNRFGIAVVPVVVTSNFRRMDELFARVDALYTKYHTNMAIHVKPMHPYDQPMTVVYDREIYREFMKLREKWMSSYSIPLSIRGFGELDPLAERGAKSSLRCFRQYFSSLLTGDGEIQTCKPAKYYDYYHDRFMKGGPLEKLSAATGALRDLVLSPCSPSCPQPCEYMDFLAGPLSAPRASELIRRAKEHGLVVTPDGDGEALRFMKQHLNRDFVIDVP